MAKQYLWIKKSDPCGIWLDKALSNQIVLVLARIELIFFTVAAVFFI